MPTLPGGMCRAFDRNGMRPAGTSGRPIVYSSGIVLEEATDLWLPGPTESVSWSHRRNYSSRLNAQQGTLPGIQGVRWEVDLLTGFLAQTDVDNDNDLDLELYVDATHKRVFTNNGSGSYTAPPDFLATLTTDSPNQQIVIRYPQSGKIWVFRDFSVQDGPGTLKRVYDDYQAAAASPSYLEYRYDASQPGGRIHQVAQYVEGVQKHLIVYSYTVSGTNMGRLASIDVQNASGQVLQRVRYTYFVTGAGYSGDVGSDGDLIQVTVLQRDSGDNLANSTDGDFSIQRHTQYRYYDGQSGDGQAHQVKMVLECGTIQAILDASATLTTPADILEEADSFVVTGTTTLAQYASRSFTYYTADLNTSTSQSTAWSGAGTENLASAYSGTNLDETGWVKSETVHGSCGSCGGGDSGITLQYYYMDLNGGSSTDPNAVVRLTIEDTLDADGSFVQRKILGLNDSRQALREAVAIGSIASPQYWCTSTVLGAPGGASSGDDYKVIEERQVSAHTKVTHASGLIDEFLDPTGNSGANDGSTLNGTNDAAGVVHLYAYNTAGRLTTTKLQNTQERASLGATTGYIQSHLAYGNGTTDPTYVVTAEYAYPEATTDTEATSRIATTYGYSYYGSGESRQVKVKLTLLPTVPTAQNGSNSTTYTAEYYDEQGRLRWTRDPLGTIRYSSYHPTLGQLAYVMEDVETDDLPAEITNPPSGQWVAWSGAVPSGFENTDNDNLQRTQKLAYDAVGRPVKTTDAAGRVTYTVYEDTRTLVFRDWLLDWDAGTTGNQMGPHPILVMEEDDAGNPVRQYEVDPARTALNGSNEPDGLLANTTQAHYVSLTQHVYDAKGRLTQVWRYHDIPASGEGTEGTNYYTTRFGYDAQGRRWQTTTADGTITLTQFDAMGRPTATWIGTDATGATNGDPDGTGAPNNLKLVSEVFYDGATTAGALTVGDGLVTLTRQHADASTAYVTAYQHDWRGRLVQSRGPDHVTTQRTLDNLGRVTVAEVYADADTDWTIDSGELRRKSETLYDPRDQAYRTYTYEVIAGTAGDRLATNLWYDAAGQLIKQADGNGRFAKMQFDALGAIVASYVCYDTDETAYGDADDVAGDTVIGQNVLEHNAAGQAILATRYERVDGSAKTGALSDSWQASDSRRSYAAMWYDAAGRPTHTADYGTNGGQALTRPATAPEPDTSDDYLVAKQVYDLASGRVYRTIDNLGRIRQTVYDDLGRTLKVIENYVDGSVGVDEYASDRTTEYVYDSSGRLERLRAHNPKGSGVQVETQDTLYVYDPQAHQATSELYRNDRVTAVIYPDADDTYSSGGAAGSRLGNGTDTTYDRVEYRYDRLGRKLTAKDPNGTVHTYSRDSAGRLQEDSVTTLGSGVDGAIRSIAYTYTDLGQPYQVTSESGSGQPVNRVTFSYDGWGNVSRSDQDHNASGYNVPYVQYTYEDGAVSGEASHLRLQKVRYPNGREVYASYPASGVGYHLSRPQGLTDGGTTTYAQYTYLGAGRIVQVAHSQVTGGLTLTYGSGGTYGGLDRFGRVIDQSWQTDAAVLKDRFRYGYDRNSNPIWREVGRNLPTPPSGLDAYYAYDGLDRLTGFDQGTLSGTYPGYTGITSRNRNQAWTLEALGNWRQFHLDANGDGLYGAASDLAQARTHNAVNEIFNSTAGAAITETAGQTAWVDPVHDRTGNMTSGPNAGTEAQGSTQRQYGYDAWNRLAWVNDLQGFLSIYYSYDGLHRRIYKLVPNGEYNIDRTDYYYNESWQVLEERTGINLYQFDAYTPVATPRLQYVWDLRYIDAPVLRDENKDADGDCVDGSDQRLYYTNDANMNVTALVNPSGQVVERYAYDPYGRLFVLNGAADADGAVTEWSADADNTSDWGNEILYCGYRLDPETRLYHVRYRYLHPTLGRWMTRDPIGYGDGTSLREYAHGRPLFALDPLGLRVSVLDDVPSGLGTPGSYWLEWDDFAKGGFGPDQRGINSFEIHPTIQEDGGIWVDTPSSGLGQTRYRVSFGCQPRCPKIYYASYTLEREPMAVVRVVLTRLIVGTGYEPEIAEKLVIIANAINEEGKAHEYAHKDAYLEHHQTHVQIGHATGCSAAGAEAAAEMDARRKAEVFELWHEGLYAEHSRKLDAEHAKWWQENVTDQLPRPQPPQGE